MPLFLGRKSKQAEAPGETSEKQTDIPVQSFVPPASDGACARPSEQNVEEIKDYQLPLPIQIPDAEEGMETPQGPEGFIPPCKTVETSGEPKKAKAAKSKLTNWSNEVFHRVDVQTWCREMLRRCMTTYQLPKDDRSEGHFPVFECKAAGQVENDPLYAVGRVRKPAPGEDGYDAVVELAFRGSVDLDAWMKRVDSAMEGTTFGPDLGQVNAAFFQAYQEIAPSVAEKIEEGLANLGAQVSGSILMHVTGHGFGGALASLAAYDWSVKGFSAVCVTFGCPRVGDEAFAEGYRAMVSRTIRITNKNDPVQNLPPKPPGAIEPAGGVQGLGQKMGGWLNRGAEKEQTKVAGYVHVVSHSVLDGGFSNAATGFFKGLGNQTTEEEKIAANKAEHGPMVYLRNLNILRHNVTERQAAIQTVKGKAANVGTGAANLGQRAVQAVKKGGGDKESQSRPMCGGPGMKRGQKNAEDEEPSRTGENAPEADESPENEVTEVAKDEENRPETPFKKMNTEEKACEPGQSREFDSDSPENTAPKEEVEDASFVRMGSVPDAESNMEIPEGPTGFLPSPLGNPKQQPPSSKANSKPAEWSTEFFSRLDVQRWAREMLRRCFLASSPKATELPASGAFPTFNCKAAGAEGLAALGRGRKPTNGEEAFDAVVEIVFLGSGDLENWMSKMDPALAPNPFGSGLGEINKDFLQAYLTIKPSVVAEIDGCLAELGATKYPNTLVLASGHGLGGAMATLAAYDLAVNGFVTACITFGCPKIGDENFAEKYNSIVGRTLRITNANDPVPKLPQIPPPEVPEGSSQQPVGIGQKVGKWFAKRTSAAPPPGGYTHVAPTAILDGGFATAASGFFKGLGQNDPAKQRQEELAQHGLKTYLANLDTCSVGLRKRQEKMSQVKGAANTVGTGVAGFAQKTTQAIKGEKGEKDKRSMCSGPRMKDTATTVS